MSSMFKGLRTVIYHVDDLARARGWYADALGLAPYFDEPFYVGFSVGGYELGLHPDMTGVKVGNNVVAYWGVDDAQAAVDHLVAKGATLASAPQNVGDGIVVATVTDPWGNTFGVICNPHFKR